MNDQNELYLELKDNEWPFTGVDHDRNIVAPAVFVCGRIFIIGMDLHRKVIFRINKFY